MISIWYMLFYIFLSVLPQNKKEDSCMEWKNICWIAENNEHMNDWWKKSEEAE
jgi:hypothetical protein